MGQHNCWGWLDIVGDNSHDQLTALRALTEVPSDSICHNQKSKGLQQQEVFRLTAGQSSAVGHFLHGPPREPWRGVGGYHLLNPSIKPYCTGGSSLLHPPCLKDNQQIAQFMSPTCFAIWVHLNKFCVGFPLELPF